MPNEQQKTVAQKIVNVLDAIPAQAKTLVRQIKPGLGTTIENTLQNTGVDTMDWVATIPRVGQVFACAYANGTYDPNPLLPDHHPLGVDGSDYVTSGFDKFMYHKDTQGNLHLTHAGMAMVGIVGGVGFFSGVARGVYKHQHQKNLNSRKRLRTMMGRHLTEAEANECATIEDEKESALAAFMKIDALNEFQNEIKKFNADRKNGEALTEDEKDRINQKFNATFQQLVTVPENRVKLDALVTAYQKQDILDQAIVAAKAAANQDNPYEIAIVDGQFNIQRVRGSVFNKQRNPEKQPRTSIDGFLHRIAKLDNHRYAKRIAYPFNWMVNQSMWYWLAWFMAFLIVGPIVLGTAPVIIALGAVAAGIGLLISAITGTGRLNLHSARKKQRADITALLANDNAVIENKDPTFKASILAMKDYYTEQLNAMTLAKKAAFLLRKYEKYQGKDAAIANGQLTVWKSRTFMEFEHAQNLKKIEALRATLADAPHVAANAIKATKVPKKSIMSYLQPSGHERRLRIANNIIGAMAFGFVIPFFITQLLGGVLSAVLLSAGFSVAMLAPGATTAGIVMAVINNATLSTIWGGLWAAKNGLIAFITQQKTKTAYEKKLDALNKPVDGVEGGKSKIKQFDELQKSYDKKLAYLKQNQPALYAKMQTNLVGSKHWGATNHHYHEKQRAKATPWTRIKQTMNRAYEVIGGAETGVLVARVLFVSGCVLGFSLLGAATVALTGVTFGLAPVVFSAIAGFLGGILGANRLLKYILGKRQEHREKFVNTFDDRLKFLEQKNQEMDKLLGIEPAVVNNNAPGPDHQADEAAPAVRPAPIVNNVQAAQAAPAVVPGREEHVRATTESTTSPPNSEKIISEAIETPVQIAKSIAEPIQPQVVVAPAVEAINTDAPATTMLYEKIAPTKLAIPFAKNGNTLFGAQSCAAAVRMAKESEFAAHIDRAPAAPAA